MINPITMFSGEALPLLGGDLPLIGEIGFGADENLGYVLGNEAVHLVQPGGDVLEGSFVVDSVCQQNPMCTSVVAACYRPRVEYIPD